MSFIATGAMVALIPMRAYAALQDTPIADFPETNGEVYAIAPASDGSVYIGGTFTTVDGVSRRNVARILSDNSVDPDFNPNIYEDGDGYDTVRSMVLHEDNSTLYVGGGFDTVNGSATRHNLAAVDSETGQATSFNPNVNDVVYVLELNESTDVLYAGGSFTSVNGGTNRKDLAAFSTDTGTVTAFDIDIDTATCDTGAETVYDLLFDTVSDQLYVAGHFYGINSQYSPGLVAVDPETGVQNEVFEPILRYVGEDADLGQCPDVMAIQKIGGTIYAGGIFDRVNGSIARTNFAAFDSTTGGVAALDREFDSTIYDMTVDPIDGDLYLGGSFSTVDNETTRNEVAALNVTSGELTVFNPNITTEPPLPSVHALAFNGRGYLFVGGTFDHVGGEPRASLAAFANLDPDNDNITSEVEDAAPNNGDANNDGTPDAEQSHVTSLVNTETNQYVTVVTPDGTTITTVTTEAAPDEDGYTHLFGLTGFTVTGVTPGATIPIEIFHPNPDNIAADSITPKKYFPSIATYEDLSGAAVTSLTIDSQPTLQLSYSLTDGGDYDLDGTADGSITDPVSLATTATDTEALADTGQNLAPIGLFAIVLLSFSLVSFKKGRQTL